MGYVWRGRDLGTNSGARNSRFSPFSSPEAALLLVSTKNRDKSNIGSPRFTDFPSLCACSESSLTKLIGSGLNLLCLQSHSKTECNWTRPEVAILGADQKERGLWWREWFSHCPYRSSSSKSSKPKPSKKNKKFYKVVARKRSLFCNRTHLNFRVFELCDI